MSKKMGYCLDCKDEKLRLLVAKRCQYHYKKHRHQISLERKKKRQGEKGIDPIVDRTLMNLWFLMRVKELKGFCSECGAPLDRINYKFAKCSVAHIFPKSTFPSIKYHKANWIELGASCGCHSKGEVFENLIQMKVWPEALMKMRILYPCIQTKEEKRRIPQFILDEILVNV